MKNVFKFLGLALVAGTFLFVSCKKDDDNVSQVTFNGNSWNVKAVSGKSYTHYNEIQAGFFSDSVARYPWVGLDAVTKVGTYTGTFDTATYGYGSDNLISLYYYTAADQLVTIISKTGDTSVMGDYWAKNISYSVDSFDATGATISFTLSADMFDFLKVYQSGMNVAGASTKALSMKIYDATVTADNNNYNKAANFGKIARPSQAKGARIVK
jgi:hypothetical protein